MTILLTHLAWVGSGFACDMTDGAAMAAPDVMGDMSGMSMPGMDMAGMTERQSGGESEHHHAPCDFPWAPEGCQSMTPCAPIALASVTELLRTPDAMPSAIAVLAVLPPPSIQLPPEPPPPRA